MKKYLAGLDVGTTGARCMLFDLAGNTVGGAYREYGSYYPHPGWVEQDQHEMIGRAMEAARAAIQEAKVDPKQIASIGISTQRSVTCPIDENGQAVRRSISWQDARAGVEVEELREKIDADEYYRTSGLPLGTTWVISKLLWMRKHEPELFAKTKIFAQMSDVVLRAFGADGFYTDLGSTVFYGAWDVAKCQWSEKLLKQLDVSPEMFGKPTPAGTQVGKIPAPIAERTGFAVGTPLCIAAGDQNCSAVGMGAIRSGIGTVTLGTCGMAILATDQPVPGFGGMMSTNHALPGLWEIEGITNAAASTYRWFRDEIGAGCGKGDRHLLCEAEKGTNASCQKRHESDSFAEKEPVPFSAINQLAATAEPGCKGLLFLPYFATAATPHWDHTARGAYIGLSFAHGRAELARAVMEGVTLEIRDIMQRWFDSGHEVKSLRIGGGATHSPLWNQIQADVYGRPVEQTQCEESTCLGAALLGGVGAGVFDSIPQAVEQMVHLTRQIDPNAARHRLYEELYATFTDTYTALSKGGIFGKLSQKP